MMYLRSDFKQTISCSRPVRYYLNEYGVLPQAVQANHSEHVLETVSQGTGQQYAR